MSATRVSGFDEFAAIAGRPVEGEKTKESPKS